MKRKKIDLFYTSSDHTLNPRNVGDMADADSLKGRVDFRLPF